MMGRTHAITGVAFGLGFAAATGQVATTPVVAYAFAYGAALIPDLDLYQSKASAHLAAKPAHAILLHFGHRRFTHSILGTLLFLGFLLVAAGAFERVTGWTVPLSFLEVTLVGYISHIIADMANKQGVQLFYPWKPFGIEWWSFPLPRSLRISTIHDVQRLPVTPRGLQQRIHTEKWFWMYPMLALIAFVTWHHAIDLVTVAQANVLWIVAHLPPPLAAIASAFLE